MPRPAAPKKPGQIAVALLAFACLAGAGLFHTWLQIDGLTLGYRLSTVTHVHEKRLREHEALALEVATLEAPRRIERLARKTLGMVTPKPGQVVVVREPPLPKRPDATAKTSSPHRKGGVLASIVEDLHGP